MTPTDLINVIRTERERHENLAPKRQVFNIVCSCGYITDHVSVRGEWEAHLDEEMAHALAPVLRRAHEEGYQTARADMVSGAFIGGPTYEALRLSFTGQRIERNLRQHLAQLLEAEIKKPVWERDIYVNDGLRDAARIVRGETRAD